jgi:hypothetical protein
MRLRKKWHILILTLLGLCALAVILSFAIQQPLRRSMEARINKTLKGYRVSVGRLVFHPIGFSLDVEELLLSQISHPDPPIASIPRLRASIHWRELLAVRLVSDLFIERPEIFINIQNIREERRDKIPVGKKGWQEALQSVYPLRINRFEIGDAKVAYVPEGDFRPLEMTHVNFVANNIRNIHSPEGAYPSKVNLEGVVFETGKLSIDGHANFLAEPHVSFKTDIILEKVDLSYFEPVISPYRFSVRKGVLSSVEGNVEHYKGNTIVNVDKLVLRQVEGYYTHDPIGKEVVKKLAEVAKEVKEKPKVAIHLKHLDLNESTLELINLTSRPSYRIFVTDTEMKLTNFSKDFAKGPINLRLHCKFMGSGDAVLLGTFRQETKQADFDLQVAIENTSLPEMNDLLKAHGKFDVAKGTFSLYSEISIKGGKVSGYVKPFFRDIEVYKSEQERGKSLLQKFYEGMIGTLAEVLEHRPKRVATKVDISGALKKPDIDILGAILHLFQNAFFKAILPGFETKIEQPAKSGSE